MVGLFKEGLLGAVGRDVQRFSERLRGVRPPIAGLHTYRLGHENQRRRVHLRIDQSGEGVLFIDVTDVVHLNATAAEIAKWALDDVHHGRAVDRLRSRHGRAQESQWRRDLDAIYEMVARLRHTSPECPTCALTDVRREALFQTPVHAPFKADLALTYECTNDCPHCYNETDRLGMDMMPAERWKQVIDRLCDVGVPHLIFTGGEATLHPELTELIRYADRRGPICGLNTNGRRLSHRKYVDQLRESGLNHVQITLGSHRADVHDRMMNAHAFDQTVRGIENALAGGLHAITNTTLMRMNADHIEDTVTFLYELGIRTFAVNGMIYSGGGFSSPQAIPEQEMACLLMGIRDRARKLGMKFLWYTPTQYCRLSPVELDIGAKRCNAGEYSICIEPNGDVLPCQSYYVAAGNLLRDPWEKVWHSELFRSFRDRESDPQRYGLPEMCWECPDLSLCGGGCRIEREAADGVRTGEVDHSGCRSGCCGGGCGVGQGASDQDNVCGSDGNAVGVGFVSVEALVRPTKRRSTGVFSQAKDEGR